MCQEWLAPFGAALHPRTTRAQGVFVPPGPGPHILPQHSVLSPSQSRPHTLWGRSIPQDGAEGLVPSSGACPAPGALQEEWLSPLRDAGVLPQPLRTPNILLGRFPAQPSAAQGSSSECGLTHTVLGTHVSLHVHGWETLPISLGGKREENLPLT